MATERLRSEFKRMEQWLTYAVLGHDGIYVSFCSKGVNKTAENYNCTYCRGSLWIY